MKAVLHFRAGPGFRERIQAAKPDWLEVVVVEPSVLQALKKEMADADILLHVLEPATAGVMALAPNLRFIQKIGVGLNTIDLETAKSGGIAVANMPGTNTRAVAEMTLALMFSCLRRLPTLDAETRAGRGWSGDPTLFDKVAEIAGKTVGLVGFGAVPRILAPVLDALGANLIYTATEEKSDVPAAWRDLPALLGEADIVSLHVPLTPETDRMIDAEAIAAMKTGSYLINTARGALVDEAALLDALNSGKLAAAGLDVFAGEPVDRANPLLNLDNVVVAPHVSWLTPETLDRSLAVAFENCRRLRDGEALLHAVAD